MKKIIIPVMLLMLIACNSGDNKSDSSSTLSGVVKVDGSSTVFPVTEAVAEADQSIYDQSIRDPRRQFGCSKI